MSRVSDIMMKKEKGLKNKPTTKRIEWDKIDSKGAIKKAPKKSIVNKIIDFFK